MEFNIQLNDMNSFYPATDEDRQLFEADLDCYKARYRTAKRAFRGSPNEKMADLMLSYIEQIEQGQATDGTFNKTLILLQECLNESKSINEQGFLGLAIDDLVKASKL